VACHADTLIFLTDVAGVKDAEGTVMPWLNTKQIPGMVENAVVAGGMLPKLEACRQALRKGVGRVRILRRYRLTLCHSFTLQARRCTEVICA